MQPMNFRLMFSPEVSAAVTKGPAELQQRDTAAARPASLLLNSPIRQRVFWRFMQQRS